MGVPGLVATLLVCGAASVTAQTRWSGGPLLRGAWATGTMGRYLGGGYGFGIALRPASHPIVLEASLTRFGTRTVTRYYEGKSFTPVDIASSARFALVAAGPEFRLPVGFARLRISVQGGAAHALATGSTILPGDSAQVQRSGTYTTLTWAAMGRAALVKRLGTAELAFDAGVVQLGRTKFLREYNLPIGVISGIYLYPTPYAPLFWSAGASLRMPL